MSNASDSPSLQASLTPNTTAYLGDILTLSVQATHAAALPLEPPTLPRELGTFEIFASTTLPVELSGPVQIDRFQILLQNFTTGQQVLPGIAFTYPGPDNKPLTLKTPEQKVMIAMIPPGPKDKGDIRGIKGTIGPVGISSWWWLLLVFAVVIGAICFWKERQKRVEGPPPEPPVPADQMALDKLRDLLASGWVEAGQIKEFYSGISDAVRAYIETGFACPALERTTGELMRDLRKRSLFDSPQTLELKQLLEDCDLVKFAKFRPDASESLKTHASAVTFVEQTKAKLKSLTEKDR